MTKKLLPWVTILSHYSKIKSKLYIFFMQSLVLARQELFLTWQCAIRYIECLPVVDESKVLDEKMMEPTADINFGDLVERIGECFAKYTIECARIEAKCLIALEFTARVLGNP